MCTSPCHQIILGDRFAILPFPAYKIFQFTRDRVKDAEIILAPIFWSAVENGLYARRVPDEFYWFSRFHEFETLYGWFYAEREIIRSKLRGKKNRIPCSVNKDCELRDASFAKCTFVLILTPLCYLMQSAW